MDQLRTLCVMGTFDDQANQKIYQIKDTLRAKGISTDAYEPHITFGIYAKLEEESLLLWIEKVAARHKKIPICFNHFGFFPDVRLCFLAPCSSHHLLELHSNIHEKYDDCCVEKGCLYSLKQNNWVPHMTIASVEPGQEEALLSSLWDSFSPFAAEIIQLKITSSDMSQDVGVFKLQV